MAKTTKSTRTAKPELDTEVASRLRDPFEQVFMGVLRTNDPLLLEKGGGTNFHLYRDLERDGKVYAALQKRTLALVSRPWQVEPVEEGEAGQKDAAKVQDMLKRCNFDRICKDLMEALLVGFAVGEVVWTVRDGMVVPARVVNRSQRRFVYVQDDEQQPPRLHLLTQQDMIRGEPLEDNKFIVHRVNPKDDNPYGTGLGLQLYWPVFFKRKGIVAWNKLNDRFGSPTPWGKYPRNASQKEKNTLFDALKAFSNDGVVLTPEGTMIELLESKLTGSISTQEGLCNYMDDWIAEVVLGQEPRANGGGALAAASKERQAVRLDLTQADSDLLSETLNATLIKWICEYNGLAPCLVYRVIKADENLKEASDTDKNVYEMGFKPTLEHVRSKYGEGWEEREIAPPGATQPDGRPVGFAEPGDAPDPFAQVLDELAGDWQPVMHPLVKALQAAIDEAKRNGETAEQLLARLPDLFAEMDTGPLTERLTQLTFAARLAGQAGIEAD